MYVYRIVGNFAEESFAILFNIVEFAIKILRFCSKYVSIVPFRGKMLWSENFVNLAKLQKIANFKPHKIFPLYGMTASYVNGLSQ